VTSGEARGDNYRFKIGDWVVFTHLAYMRMNEDGEKVVCAVESKGVGQIAGAVRRRLGLYSSTETLFKDGTVRDLYNITQTGLAELYKVRQGMINRPVEILEEHLIACPRPKAGLPWFYSYDSKYGKSMNRSASQRISRAKR